jgi:amino acid transporter
VSTQDPEITTSGASPQAAAGTATVTATADPAGAQDLPQGAVSGLGVFSQGLAAAAPSVALASVPASLYLVAGKGAVWAAIAGGILVYLVGYVISLQARRTVSSGSLGTYAGNGLGPWGAFATGWALILGYIGFAAGGILGAVLYFNSFIVKLGAPADNEAIKVVILLAVAAAAIYLPLRGVSLSVKVGLGFEVVSLIAIFVIIVASYATYGPHFDSGQWSLSHLTNSTTFIAAVTGVGAYAGFESSASLGHEAQDAHRNVPRAILRLVIALSVVYLISTYPEVLGFNGPHGVLGPDSTPLPVVAANAGVSWTSWIVDITLGIAMTVFAAAVINSGARSLFTLSRERALPRLFGAVHRGYRTPHVSILLIGAVGLALGLYGTVSPVGRLQWDVYVGIVSSYSYLLAYLLVAIATPLWLRRIRALTPATLVVSALAAAGIGYVIYNNLVPVPPTPYNVLPYVFAGLIVVGLAWYLYLVLRRPEVARRVGSIQTLSESEQLRLAELGILEAVTGRPAPSPAE